MEQGNPAQALALESLMKQISSVYSFTPEKYPELLRCTTQNEVHLFCINHLFKHLAKNVGAVAAQSEHFDHTGGLNIQELETTAVKLLINALNLLNVLRVPSAEIVARIQKELH